MTEHSWSFLSDELNMDPTFNIDMTDIINMNQDPNRYKYDEDTILKELLEYILAHTTLTTLLVMTKFRHLI